MKIEIKPKELIITKSYLKTLISKPITLKEIHNQVIIDFSIDSNNWNLEKTKNLFKLANINLRSKPRKSYKVINNINNIKKEEILC